jgi:hypothetical protein
MEMGAGRAVVAFSPTFERHTIAVMNHRTACWHTAGAQDKRVCGGRWPKGA